MENEELKVGMYVRNNNGFIGKIIEIHKHDKRPCDTYYYCDCHLASGFYENFKKYSDDIIDLVEEDDIVNDYFVRAVYLDGVTKYIKLDNEYDKQNGIRTYSEDIRSILTKEQIEELRYELE